MQYTFYTWRARCADSGAWQELGWRMTEDDARRWAEQTGREIERVGPQHERRPYGGALVS